MIEETFKYDSIANLRKAIDQRIGVLNAGREQDTVISLDSNGDVEYYNYSVEYYQEHDILCSEETAEAIMLTANKPKLLYLIHLYFSLIKPNEYNKEQLW